MSQSSPVQLPTNDLPAASYPFFSQLARVLNSGQSRSVVLSGNIYDLYFDGKQYVPILPFLVSKTQVAGLIQVVYELNGPVRLSDEDRNRLREAWTAWKNGVAVDAIAMREVLQDGSRFELRRREFDQYLRDAIGNATQALEFLRQLTICSRTCLKENLLIFIEGADMLLPAGDGDVARMNDAQLRRIAIVTDWFSDPAFFSGRDAVVLIAESRSQIHPRVSRLPQVLSVEIPAPDLAARQHFITVHSAANLSGQKHDPDLVGIAIAGLSLHAMRQLLLSADYLQKPVTRTDTTKQVEAFIQGQLGEDVIEFKKPMHRLSDCVGFSKLKEFLHSYLIPRMKLPDDRALPGAAIAGPIGGGKTFIFEAVAAELDMPVLVLKNIRSQWFGQTDVIFERLRRVLEALEKVVIFVDEADTQFGSVGEGAHETERRLTGKIQGMMSDTQLRGKVIWLLMTARIHLLSPDIRRPGRVGDLIIPILDPTGEDRKDFIRWMIGPTGMLNESLVDWLDREGLEQDYSSAGFAALRSQFKAIPPKDEEELKSMIRDFIQPAIKQTRRYQTLQALVNCTRRSLLPDPNITEEDREAMEREIRALELEGIR
ncbi:Proteasome-associated ATPase [Pirellula sp. SH-Sr6A]|uniref:AAA family ATPase n=1 Tax=Pirellula sp. SH-Sr6A TaxID=1632865 RepID=UPI00078BF3FB|nr:ATP-binding protein [Pirellula sp. SH-Sr6A]AMV30471.1 Proteasome-associated ATPase [Pirellula sp. SH-Sr6A]